MTTLDHAQRRKAHCLQPLHMQWPPAQAGWDWRPGSKAQQPRPTRLFHVPVGVVLRAWFRLWRAVWGHLRMRRTLPGTPTLHGLPPLIGVGSGRFVTCRKEPLMADTRTASAPGRMTLRVCAQPSPRPSTTPSEYARAYMLRLARRLASRAALRRAELRARAFELVAADRLSRGGAA
jgi:hypothetical protein